VANPSAEPLLRNPTTGTAIGGVCAASGRAAAALASRSSRSRLFIGELRQCENGGHPKPGVSRPCAISRSAGIGDRFFSCGLPPHVREAHNPLVQRGAPVFPTLTDEQRRFVSTVRELAQSEFRERAPRWMDGTFPWDNMKPLAELGVLGMAVPEEYGGLGLPVFDTALVLEEIAKTCYVTA